MDVRRVGRSINFTGVGMEAGSSPHALPLEGVRQGRLPCRTRILGVRWHAQRVTYLAAAVVELWLVLDVVVVVEREEDGECRERLGGETSW